MEIFDICACKCADFKSCSCRPLQKVPKEKQCFLFLTRNGRLDAKYTPTVDRRFSNASSVELNESEYSSPDLEASDCANSDDGVTLAKTIGKKYNTLKLDRIAETSDRMSYSNGEAASMITATLTDVGE